MNYDFTYWVVTDKENKIAQIIKQNRTAYPTMEILELSKVKEDLANG